MDKKKVKELLKDAGICFLGYKRNGCRDLISMGLQKLHEAQEELSKADWVSVEDGLPKYGENVLAISKDGCMDISYRRKIPRDKISTEVMDDNGFILNFNLRCSTITHWKPIEKLEE